MRGEGVARSPRQCARNHPLQWLRVSISFSPQVMRTIGKYEVVEKIGEGGFGTIFKGFDPHIRRFVAIKSCTSDEEDLRSRFLHEAQIAGNLQHRHVVTVYDFGLQDGVPYLVQEYLSGEDLDRKIKRQEFIPLAEKLLYLIQVARGLEYAHSRGVVHRDVKPANIRILEDGTAKIMDFGIAKLADQETGLTATGMTIGTAAYLAPEQIRGEPIDRRTDIFSWGVTAWELLAYRRPFTGQHISTVLYQILHVPAPRLRPAVADCPEELETIVRRCLEKEPGRRYGDCGELLRDIDRALEARRVTSEIPLGLPAARQAAEMAETRSLDAPAPPRRAAGTRAAPLPGASDASGELVDLDLDSTAQSRRTPRSISTTQAARTRGFAWGRWVAAVLALVATAAVAALVLGGRNAGPAAPSRSGGAGDGSPPAASVGGAAVLEGGERAEGGEGVEAGGALAAAAGAVPAAPGALPAPSAAPAAPSATPAATPEVTATSTPPAPPPRPAYVLVPAAWSPEVTVSVRGQRRRSLGEAQRIAVTPGRRVTLVFEYRGDGYSATESRTVTVHEGATVDVENPLPAPGRVQVQQKLGTPPGRVSLGGEELGVGRVRRTLAPGPHRLRIEPSSAGGGNAIDREVTVPSGRKLVLTFDLTTGGLVEVVAPLD